MAGTLKCNWFAPGRHFRTWAIEQRHRRSGWRRLMRGPGGRSMTNFGDELAPYVLEDATARKVVWAPFGQEDVNVIGSNIVQYAREGGAGLIWGMGVHNPVLTDAEKAAVRPKILAIRGPDSMAHLGLPGGTPMGDPGLLARALKPDHPQRNGKKVLIAHFSAFANNASVHKMRQLERAGFEIIAPNLHPLEVLWRIAGADLLVCSGLHGTIVAHAMGTPVELFTFSDDPAYQAAYKYVDYFHSVGGEAAPVPWNSLIEAPEAQRARIERLTVDGEGYAARITPMVEDLYRAAQVLR